MPDEAWVSALGEIPISDAESGETIPEVYPPTVDAFCRQTGLRYPTRQEWDIALASAPESGLVRDASSFEWVRSSGEEPILMTTAAGDPPEIAERLNKRTRVIAFRPAY